MNCCHNSLLTVCENNNNKNNKINFHCNISKLILTLKAVKYLCISYGEFEIIITVSFSYFHFIWIPLLWVYGHYKSVILSVRGWTLDVRIYKRQILTSKVAPRAERVKASSFRWVYHILWHYFHWNMLHASLVVNPFSAGTVFMRQNLTSVDVRFWRIKTIQTSDFDA